MFVDKAVVLMSRSKDVAIDVGYCDGSRGMAVLPSGDFLLAFFVLFYLSK